MSRPPDDDGIIDAKYPGEVRVLVAGRSYPPTVATSQVAVWWGCSSELLQREVRGGELPVEPLHLGRRLRWPTAAVAMAAGLPVEVVVDGAR
ncbi:MAG TPA: hypothetical protein VF711_10940 [Acidimicrobiales bacterium]